MSVYSPPFLPTPQGVITYTHTHPLLYTQGVIEDGAPQETAVIDYAIHQHKLLTLLAAAYAWHFQVCYIGR